MSIKLLLGAAAIAAGGFIYFGKDKYDKYNSVLTNLQFKIKSVKKVNMVNGIVVFDADIEVQNPTNMAIDVPGNQILLKNIHFYSKSGAYLGIATPNIADIQLPANGSRLITNIPVKVSLKTIGNSFSEILGIVSNPKNLHITADIEAFGQSITV
ncbi:MAG: hypothetical protein JJE07_07175 [Flavobacteriaceae bacterium]|nr:hypothetical protein [Flavobacteriaceae bacterium]